MAGIQALDRRLGRWRGVLRVTIAAGILYAVGVSLPARAGMIAGLEPEFKLHPEVEMRRQGVDSALVFVKVGWGNRLIARLWGWDVSASETERAFRVVDGCRLQYALDQADSLTAAGVDSADARAVLLERLRALRHMKLPVRAGVLPDHSVRVDTTMALSGRCYKEAARDASGYTLYASLVWRQDPWLEKGIVYARDMGPEMNGRLIDRFRGRPWYLYAPPSPQRGAVPVLTPLRPSGE